MWLYTATTGPRCMVTLVQTQYTESTTPESLSSNPHIHRRKGKDDSDKNPDLGNKIKNIIMNQLMRVFLYEHSYE